MTTREPTIGPGLAFVSYLLATLVLAFPLLRDIGGSLTGDLGDPVLNSWILWWNTTAIPFTEAWWNPPVFYPSTNTLAYSEHLVGLSIISTPVYWLTGSPVVAYNVAFLLTFPLSGLAAFLLGFELTRRRDAAWLAGLAFAFAPYRMDQLPHLQVLASYWMPLGLFALHRHYRDARVRWLALFGVCTLMNGLTNGYYLLFYPPLILLWVLWFTPKESWWRRAGAVAGTGALAMLVLLPSLLTYRQVHTEIGFDRPTEEILGYSADVSGLLSGPTRSLVWSFPEALYRPEGQLFPGLTIAVVIAVALWRVRWRHREPEPAALRGIRYAVGVISVLFAGGVAARAIFGPWQLGLPGMLISVYTPDNVVAQGMLFWVLSAALSPVGAWAYRRHSVFAFYCVATFLLFLFALGPEPDAFGFDFMAHSVYRPLTWLPGYDALRAPARFWMLATISLSALVGLSFARLVPSSSRYRVAAVAIVAIGILLDGWIVWPTATVPAPSAVLEHTDGGVLELPLGVRNHDTTAMLRTITHRQPLVNGFSGYEPPHYWSLRYGLEQQQSEMLDLIAGLGMGFVRIDRRLDGDGAIERFVAGHPGARRVAANDSEVLFELPGRPDLTEPVAYGGPIDIAALSSDPAPQTVQRTLDGSLATRWHGGPQFPGQQLVVDLARAQPIGAIVMRLGSYRADFPRGLTIEVSENGDDWTEAWSGPTALQATIGAIRQPREIPMTFPIDGRLARYVRLRSTARDPVYYWSIAELSVLAPGS